MLLFESFNYLLIHIYLIFIILIIEKIIIFFSVDLRFLEKIGLYNEVS